MFINFITNTINFVDTNNEISHTTTIPSNVIVTGNNATVDAVILYLLFNFIF